MLPLRGRSFLRKAKGGKSVFPLPGPIRSLTPSLESPARWQFSRHDKLTQQQQLPYELLLHIFSYVNDMNDVVTLCRCSTMFRSIAEVYLYRNICLDFDGTNGRATTALKLLETIQNTHFSTVVTEIRVKFQPCRHRIDTTKGEALPKICTCGTIDKKLGTALQSMHALEVLSIDCFLCMNLSTGRHHYLTDIGTRKLREFHYECHCTMGNSFDPATLFLAPWMQSISALNWLPNLWTSIPETKLQTLIKDTRFLPNIETLQYGGPGICEELLTIRTIRRLSSPALDPSAPVVRHPNKKDITHLSIKEYCLPTLLNNVGGINQFCNLQHIGTLNLCNGYENGTSAMLDAVTSNLELIDDLKKLVSIDGRMRDYTNAEDPWDKPLLARLETTHPKLRRVFLSGNQNTAWVLIESLGIWEKRILPPFTSWDMVTGVYDDL